MHKKSVSKFFFCLFAAGCIGLMASSHAICQYTVTVTAGDFDRTGTIVSFPFPDAVEPGVYVLEDEFRGETFLQADEQNRGWFILEELSAGESITYDMSDAEQSFPGETGISYVFDANTISLQKGGQPVLSYYYRGNDLPQGLDGRYKRGGYIHPLHSPDGTVVTNHLDMNMHPHHYGVWSAWTSTEFQGRSPDFWNVHDNTGRIDHTDSLEAAWEGPVFGGLKAKNHYVDLSGSAPLVALNEEWEVRVFSSFSRQEYHMVDLVIIHTANTAQPLHLPEYHYGGAAFRGHENWDDPENVSFLTSEGYDRDSANETRARWAALEGDVDGRRAGAAMLGHPGNFRAPQPVRIHPEIPYFVFAPMQLGGFSIDAGTPYVMRYRLITYDGEADPGLLNRIWNDYAYPPGVTVAKE